MKNSNKKAFIIIFNRYFFYFLLIVLVLCLLYIYIDSKGLIEEDSVLYKIGRLFNVEPANTLEVTQQIFILTNNERMSRGLPALKLDENLSLIAYEHSRDMYFRGFFSHENPEGEDPTDRARKKGLSTINGIWEGIGENIGETPIGDVIGCGYVSSEESIAKCAVDSWMNSPGHRANILNINYDVIGIGTYCTTSKCLNTQDFR